MKKFTNRTWHVIIFCTYLIWMVALLCAGFSENSYPAIANLALIAAFICSLAACAILVFTSATDDMDVDIQVLYYMATYICGCLTTGVCISLTGFISYRTGIVLSILIYTVLFGKLVYSEKQ